MFLIKTFFKKIINKLNVIKIKKKPLIDEDKSPQKYHFIEGVLYSLLSQKMAGGKENKLNVLQIGANDGYTVDPVFNFCNSLHADDTSVAAVEPIPEVFQALKKNYERHPEFKAYNLLVGDGEIGILYKIKNNYWSQYKGIIGSGISSMDYAHVVRKVNRQLPKSIVRNKNIEEIVEQQEVSCVTLTSLIKIWGHVPDFIQIDVEGHDDNVIYSLDFSQYKPKAIAFEICLLSENRKEKLFKYLYEHEYIIARASANDSCALLKDSWFCYGFHK